MTLHIADGAAQERAKYAEIWGLEEYRAAHSPGLESVDQFMSVVKPRKGESIMDFGCGAGVAMLEFEKHGLEAWGIDITDAALVPEVRVRLSGRFIEAPLWNWAVLPQQPRWDYGFCCDVLEHVPPEYTMLVVDRIMSACRGVSWLRIALRPDEFGKLIGQPLHLTVRPFDWWLIRLATIGKVMDARDLCGVGLYVVTR